MNYAMPSYRYNPNTYSQFMSKQSAGNPYGLTNESSGIFNDIDPAAGYQYFLQHNPRMSFGHDAALKRLYDTFRVRYNTAVGADPVNNSGLQWTDWLKGMDVNYELAKMPSEFRGEQPTRFGRPARYVNF